MLLSFINCMHDTAIETNACNFFSPHDVLATLLNNLKVQERQNRVCTTVAIAIVAETCSPFTVLPALMNEYRVPELNVQNGVLKSLSFMFEYIGEMGKDYIYPITPLLEDALMDRSVAGCCFLLPVSLSGVIALIVLLTLVLVYMMFAMAIYTPPVLVVMT